jgi:protein phosphatase 1 regulatory subunit 7
MGDSRHAVLDLCGGQLHNLEKFKIGEDVEEIDLTENRLAAIDERIVKLEKLKKISFRKNLLKDISALEGMRSAGIMVELVLYDNQIKRIPSLETYKEIKKLDISYNKIRSMQPVELVSTSVEELYLAANRISEIEGVEKLRSLQLLELGSNRIRKMQKLETLTNLRELWLGRNKIDCIEGLDTLTSLRRLSVQNNRLRVISGLQTLTNLEGLYLSFNGLTTIENLETLVHLKILDLGNNQIEKIEGIAHLTELEDLWLNDNQIKSVDELAGIQSKLSCLYMEGNPCCKLAEEGEHKSKIREMLPSLTQLDTTYF